MRLSVADRLPVQAMVIPHGHVHDSRQSHRIADEILRAGATIDFGTDLGVDEIPPALRPVFGGTLGRLPEWS